MKKIIAIGIVLFFIATIGASVSAKLPVRPTLTTGETMLYEKDQSWNIVPGGAWGRFQFASYDYVLFTETRIRCWAYGLNGYEEYAIIAYHEAWPNFDLLYIVDTDGYGDFFVYDYIDPVPADKIWVVPTTDIDIEAETFTSWNPSEYLFENNLL